MYKNSQAIFCLLLTALCSLGLSSCISTTHRVVKAWGQSADVVYWVNELGGTTDCLYRIGNELYVQAYRSSGEVSMGGVRPWGDMWLGNWDTRYPHKPDMAHTVHMCQHLPII